MLFVYFVVSVPSLEQSKCRKAPPSLAAVTCVPPLTFPDFWPSGGYFNKTSGQRET
jgi:hypothetical protein